MPSIWIFGYGSLVHRPGFEHARRVQGYIHGFRRVWHQGSTDHRGTPERPGRVVTLEEDKDAITWGVAYELPGDEKQQLETLRYLEWREKQYDVRHLVDVYGHEEQDVWSSALTQTSSATVATPSTAATAITTSTTTSTAAIAKTVATTAGMTTGNNGSGQHSSMQPSASQPDMVSTSSVTDGQTAAAAMTTSLSSPGPLAGTAAGSTATGIAAAAPGHASTAPKHDSQGNGTASAGQTAAVQITSHTTASNSTDAMMSSDEVMAYEPPSDWKKLSAQVLLPGSSDIANDGNTGPALRSGKLAGTRLLLRNVLVYIASSDTECNANYVGPGSMSEVAAVVATAEGPSGPNWEYCVRLANAMRQMGVEDQELFELEARVLHLRAQANMAAAATVLAAANQQDATENEQRAGNDASAACYGDDEDGTTTDVDQTPANDTATILAAALAERQ